MTKPPFITAAILLGIVWLATLDPSVAQTGPPENVDDIIQGFDKQAPADDDLEKLVDGFEDEPSEDPKSIPTEDDILKGFEEEVTAALPEPADEEKPSSWRLDGELAFTATCNVSPDATSPWQGFSMLRPEAELTLKNKFSDTWQGQISVRGFYDAVFTLRGRNDYTDQVLDEYETELEFKDSFIQGRLTDHLDTKIGRQIVVWGTLDNLRVTDVLNPLDLRLPGLTDIDDLRLPVTMAKLDYYVADWNLGAMVIPEVRFSKFPVFGHDFFPLQQPRPPEDTPEDGFENAQYATSLTGIFSGWDINFYYANIYADQSYAEEISSGPPEQSVRKHARINMLGAAANLALGNWLLKAEAAGFDGLRYTNTPGVDYARLDLGGGVEYSGFSETTVSLEVANRYIFDYDPMLEQAPDDTDENDFQWAFRISRDFINNTLTLTLLASTFGVKADDGAFQRLDAEYDITDAVSVRGGVILYQSGDKGIFQDVSANDRLFVVLTYNF